MISNHGYFDAFTTFGKFLKYFSSTRNFGKKMAAGFGHKFTDWNGIQHGMKNEMIPGVQCSAVVAKSEDPLKMQPVIIIKRGSTSVVILLPYNFLQSWKEYIP